jgi:hypothetical protein
MTVRWNTLLVISLLAAVLAALIALLILASSVHAMKIGEFKDGQWYECDTANSNGCSEVTPVRTPQDVEEERREAERQRQQQEQTQREQTIANDQQDEAQGDAGEWWTPYEEGHRRQQMQREQVLPRSQQDRLTATREDLIPAPGSGGAINPRTGERHPPY